MGEEYMGFDNAHPLSLEHHQFDIHLAHACNFSCESCSHFSNYHFPGILSLQTAESWYKNWATRLQPFRINLLGGEPAINPQLSEHISLARKYWPSALLRIYTNGFLLDRHPGLPVAMQSAGNCLIMLSRHYNGRNYKLRFREVVRFLRNWRAQYGIRFKIADSFSEWTRRYQDHDGQLIPFHDNDPIRSWQNCRAKFCVQMHDGKLWKCPLLAYLPMTKTKLKLSPAWDHNLTYQPLGPECSDLNLREFFMRRAESFCATCPASKRVFRKNDPTMRARPAISAINLIKPSVDHTTC